MAKNGNRPRREVKKLSKHALEEIADYKNSNKTVYEFVKMNPLEFELTKKQKELIKIFNNNKIITVTGPPGSSKTFVACYAATQSLLSGKFKKIILSKPTEVLSGTKDVGALPGPQPLSSKILTPDGWTTMGDLKKGDLVCTPSGGTAKILDIFNKGIKDIYKIETFNGDTYACIDHLWSTQTFNEHKHKKEFQIRNTQEIMDTLLSVTTKRNINKPNHFLPVINPIEFKKQNLSIPPYVLGCLLGDGSFCSQNIVMSSVDDEIIDRIKKELGYSNEVKKYGDNINYYISTKNKISSKTPRQVRITTKEGELIFESVGVAYKEINLDIPIETFKSRCLKGYEDNLYKYEFLEKDKKWMNEIKNDLDNLSLLGLKSYDKFVPEIYKISSIEDRLSILQGLMDTDGCCKKNGESNFSTTSIELANDVVDIVRSLGGNAFIRTRNRIGNKSVINNRTIESKRIAYEVYVNLPKHLNPFHLSRKAERFNFNYMHYNRISNIIKTDRKEECRCILIDDPKHLYITDNYIVTHNSLDEKMSVYMESFVDSFEEFLSPKDFKHLLSEKIIEFKPAQFLRGRSLKNSFIIIDEIQNFDIKTIKSIVTRLSRGSVMCMLGDSRQNDINKKYVAVDIFKEIMSTIDGCENYEFNRSDIVREQILIDIVDRFEKFEDEGRMPDSIKGA